MRNLCESTCFFCTKEVFELENQLFFSNLHSMTGLTVTVCDMDGTPLQDADSFSNYGKLLFLDICKQLRDTEILCHPVSVELPIYYYGCTDGNLCYLIGPVAHDELEHSKLLLYRKLVGKFANRLVYSTQLFTLSALSMVLEVCCNKNCSSAELQLLFNSHIQQDDPDIRPIRQKIRQIDTFQINHSYAEEVKSLQLVREGDLAGFHNQLTQQTMAYPSPVKSPRKNAEYMCVALLSVVARAAIEGGLPSVDSFLYSDEFLRKISEAKTEAELAAVAYEIKYTYTKLVHQVKSQEAHNLLAIKCKRLIQANLLSPISLSSLAKELGVSEEHLSRSFKAETGMTVTHYYLSKRIDLACELLSHSNMPIRDIGEYLQFHSASYFITTFKKFKEVTPSQYRKTHLTV